MKNLWVSGILGYIVFVAISYLVSSLFAGIIDQSILIQSAVSGLIFVVLMVILISVRRRRSK
jgi:uncharacterized membrane protein YhaH (DUF805 family)